MTLHKPDADPAVRERMTSREASLEHRIQWLLSEALERDRLLRLRHASEPQPSAASSGPGMWRYVARRTAAPFRRSDHAIGRAPAEAGRRRVRTHRIERHQRRYAGEGRPAGEHLPIRPEDLDEVGLRAAAVRSQGAVLAHLVAHEVKPGPRPSRRGRRP